MKKFIISRCIILVFSFLAGACANIQQVEVNSISEQIGQVPSLATQAEVPVGGIVYSQYRYWSRIAYRLDDGVNLPFILGTILAEPGEILIKALASGKPAFCTQRKVYYDPLVGPTSIACFYESQPGFLGSVSTTPGMVTMSKDLQVPVTYSKREDIFPKPNSFKNELLFQGKNGSNIKFSYREYVNDLARPAYFQDVTYDLSTLPTIITFRTVKLEVIEVNNNGMKYKVLSPFH